MTRDEKLLLLNDWQNVLFAMNQRMEEIGRAVGLDIDGPLIDDWREVQEAYTSCIAQLVGDNNGWCEWHRSENSFGFNRMAVKKARKISIVVSDAATLLDVIEGARDEIL